MCFGNWLQKSIRLITHLHPKNTVLSSRLNRRVYFPFNMGLEVSETQPGGLLHTLRAKCLHLHSATLPSILATCDSCTCIFLRFPHLLLPCCSHLSLIEVQRTYFMRSHLWNGFQIKTNSTNNQVKKFMERRLSWLGDFSPPPIRLLKTLWSLHPLVFKCSDLCTLWSLYTLIYVM